MSYKLLITQRYTKKLVKFLKKHPNVIPRYIKTIEILEVNPQHLSLRLHKLQGKLCEYYSISITMEYRVIIDFIIKDEEIIPIDIGTHDKIY